MYVEFEDEVAEIEQLIAALRRRIAEPELIQFTDTVQIEIRPINDDDRVSVVPTGNRGGTTVNYTHEGVIVDVVDAYGNMVSTLCIENADISLGE
jgi:hypothetical protein